MDECPVIKKVIWTVSSKIRVKKQEYPTEPLRKIYALQAILELAGKFFTGIANLAGNLMLAKACWDLWTILRSGWKTLNSSGWRDKFSPTVAGKRQDVTPRVRVFLLASEIFSLFLVNLLFRCQLTVTVWAVLGGWPFLYCTNYWQQNWKTWSALYISAVFER